MGIKHLCWCAGSGVPVQAAVDGGGWPWCSHHLAHAGAGLPDLRGAAQSGQEPRVLCWPNHRREGVFCVFSSSSW